MSTKCLKGVLKILDRYALTGREKDRVANTKLMNETILFLYNNENWGMMRSVIQRALIRVLRRACDNNDAGIFLIVLGLGKKINLNKRDEYGDTILMMAVKKTHYYIAKILLDSGACPDIFNFRGYTPLITAAFNENVEIVKLLMKHGSNVSSKSYSGSTAESFALWHGNHFIANMVRVEPKY